MTSEDLTTEWIKCDSCSARAAWLARGTNGELTFCGHHLNKNKAGLDSWAKKNYLRNELDERRYKMGDRANFVFVQPSGETIVLYGHWAGHNMLEHLGEAVAKAQPRWNDPSYATRIAISQMIGDGWGMETGWGLQVNEISDNEHKIPVINWLDQTMSLHEEDSHFNESNKVRGMKNEALFTIDLRTFVEKYTDAKLLV